MTQTLPTWPQGHWPVQPLTALAWSVEAGGRGAYRLHCCPAFGHRLVQPVRPAPRPPNHYLPSKANHHHSRAHCPPALEWRSPLSYLPNSKTNVTVILPNPPILIFSSVSSVLVVHSIPEDTILTSSCRGRPNNGSGGWLVRLGGAVRAAWTWWSCRLTPPNYHLMSVYWGRRVPPPSDETVSCLPKW